MLTLEQLRKFISLPQIKFGRETARFGPLASTVNCSDTLASWRLISFRKPLLATSKDSTVSRLIPSRELRVASHSLLHEPFWSAQQTHEGYGV